MGGVYISYPFCAQKCTYCNFASGVFGSGIEARYIDALRSEISSHLWHWRPETIYLGGGTPSQMSPDALAAVLSQIPGHPWREATLEAAPGTLTPDRVRSWRAAGINRVSLGVQSFVRRELARTGRKHTAEVVQADIELLRREGIGNISVDLIAGLPGQTLASWRDSLDGLLRLAPPHVSVYMLEVDEDSRLGQEVLFNGRRYGAPDVPSDEIIVECYGTAVDWLAQSGLVRYEISNFARPGCESLHNLKYWRLEPYVGFGADAHSFDGSVRWQNVESPREYVHAFDAGESPRAESTDARTGEEKFFVGLRLMQGVHVDDADRRRFGPPIDRLIREGLLENDGGLVRLTSRGVLFSNEVFEQFVA